MLTPDCVIEKAEAEAAALDRNGLEIGHCVTWLTWTEQIGTVREFGGRASEHRGTVYAAARVEWSDGHCDWLSTLDLTCTEKAPSVSARDYLAGLTFGLRAYARAIHDGYSCRRPSDFRAYSYPDFAEGYWDAFPTPSPRPGDVQVDAYPYPDELDGPAISGLDTLARVLRQLGQEPDA